ncbi:hypothetical protein JTE90_011776 [Oedothorax gibbosus]|uniref:UDP-N-acetylglucosamine transferase subunit ALG14 n=1 Tax=Oedothorax gibbosus TaxID=931172 RepID=A0AAV6VRP5_9ARAC|nr:hypothetical protein JTE90_011776 [Oedothorax gibbosus]
MMVTLGSGGHTYEMFQLIRNLSYKIQPRIYIIAETDNLSEHKLQDFMNSKYSKLSTELNIIGKIPRSREVHQSWITTVFTTFRAFIYSFILMMKHKPDFLLCNGPGTSVPLCVAAFIFHVLGWKHIKIVYVESICRVKTLSLSGKIVYQIADRFFVQWPQLKDKYPRAKYFGKLVI